MIPTRFEKELLMCHALKIDRSRLLAHPELFNEKDPAYLASLERRLNHEPIAYITGYQPFLGKNIFVDRSTLIPRPETEELVMLAFDQIKDKARVNVLDIGTGSGCIAVLMAIKHSGALICGTDISVESINMARRNAEFHGVAERVRFEIGDLFGGQSIKYDIIISNPPYIPSSDINGLMPDVRDYEPLAALDGGTAGLDHIMRIIKESRKHLAAKGHLLLEFGFGQSDRIKKAAEHEFPQVKIKSDLSGIPRFLIAGT
jgi:release factor glutamine methyltransferase